MNSKKGVSVRTRGLRIKGYDTVSLCMIARDEADDLRRCLNSVKGLGFFKTAGLGGEDTLTLF